MTACIHGEVCREYLRQRRGIICQTCPRGCRFYEPEERTCRVVTDIRAFSQTQDMHVKSCSACGYVFGSEEHRQLLPGLDKRVAIGSVVIPNYCPNCGRRVVADE